jgi:hypothetical protein
MATVRLIGQPFGDLTIGGVLTDALARPSSKHFRAAVAWAKATGLSRVGHEIQSMRDRSPGNTATLYVGIDEGGATWEGLELARQVTSNAFIYYDTGARTFHPKLYVVEGDDAATVIVGSGNATRGGLYTNYEVADWLHLDKSDGDDAAYLSSVHDYMDNLQAQPCCLRLDDASVAELRRQGYNISSESAANRRRRERRATGRPYEQTLFSHVHGLAQAPPAILAAVEADEEDTDEVLPPPASGVTEPTDATSPGSSLPTTFGDEDGRGFVKRLSAHDASHSQSPGQIVIPKQFEDFFPPMELMFDRLAEGGPRQLEARFSAFFRDGDYEKEIRDARVIRYEPAPSHRRKNIEIRFAFRDRDAFNRFSQGDLIVFRVEDGRCVIDRLPISSPLGRFGWITNRRSVQRETAEGWFTFSEPVQADGIVQLTYGESIAFISGDRFEQLREEQAAARLAEGHSVPRMMVIPVHELTML